MFKVNSYAALSATDNLKPLQIERRDVGSNDLQIQTLYCGVCHSDIHMARSEWGPSIYPLVPGHEIIGRVVSVGNATHKYKVGDLVGVGCMVDSCRTCHHCRIDLEQYCQNGSTLTYGSLDKKNGGVTYGGYSQQIVVDEHFVVRVPENLDITRVAPLLCAGITTWSPLKAWNIGPGDVVGVIGLGGLGHMGIKFAHALGARVVMITTSKDKAEDAKALGADEVLISTDSAAMHKYTGSFDFLLNTIPVSHDVNPYLALLKLDATMVIVGAIGVLETGINTIRLIGGRKRLSGSAIGGIKETQEMLDFCGKHNIVSDVEVIDIKNINEAYTRMLKNDIKYRFVIDIASLA
jgi:uncharacterized zinc-type alcohol dehydrogenase-like protein